MRKSRAKNPGSNPAKWTEERPKMAFMLALLGATDKMIADAFQVNVNTVDYWKRSKPEFLQELERGKIQADMKVVENFYLNCIDRYVTEEEVHVVNGKLETVEVQKFIKGDKWAQSRWLALRQSGAWSETTKLEITNTNINVNKLDLDGISIEQLKLLRDIGIKQIPEAEESND